MRIFGALMFASALLLGCARSGHAPAAGPAATEAPSITPQVDYCTAIYEKAFECASPREKVTIAGLRDEAMHACRTRQVRDTLFEQAELACANKPTCEEYDECQRSLDDEVLVREIAAARETGEGLADALATCQDPELTEPKVVGACRELLSHTVARQTREIEALRDAGELGAERCVELYRSARLLSKEEGEKVVALCMEAEVAARAKEASDEARKNLAKQVREVPYQCTMAVEDLETLTSEWATKRLREVLAVCYVELGKQILPAVVPDMLICDFHVERVYEVVKKFGLKDAALDPWIARADKKCKKR